MTLSSDTKSFPGFDQLYQMRMWLSDHSLYADFEENTPQFELIHGEWMPDEPLQAHWSLGSPEPEEIAQGRTTTWFYLNQRVQRVFREHQLTGWTTYPMVLHNKAGKVCPGYAGLSITGRCGPTDKERGELAPGESPNNKFATHVGLYFDESTWDGSDFFCPAGLNTYMFATAKVKQVFEEHHIPGFDFTPLTEATWIP